MFKIKSIIICVTLMFSTSFYLNALDIFYIFKLIFSKKSFFQWNSELKKTEQNIKTIEQIPPVFSQQYYENEEKEFERNYKEQNIKKTEQLPPVFSQQSYENEAKESERNYKELSKKIYEKNITFLKNQFDAINNRPQDINQMVQDIKLYREQHGWNTQEEYEIKKKKGLVS